MCILMSLVIPQEHTTVTLVKSSLRYFTHRNDCCRNLKRNVLNDTRASSKDLAIGVIFLSQTTVGILGNFSLLYHYLFLSHTGCRLKPTNVILKHLTLANSLVFLSKGLPQAMTAFGLKYFFNDFGCKFILYVERVGRGVSIGITCLLCVFQTIMISPANSRWKHFKAKAPKHIGYSIPFCWILYLAVNFIFPAYAVVTYSNKNTTKKRDFGYCLSIGHDKIVDSLYAALSIFPEFLLSVLIILSSSSMIFILHRHKQRVQHIHGTKVSSRSSHESRATQSILVLVTTFVSFHTLSSILHAYIVLFHNHSWWLVNIAALISACFPTVSPFLLMRHDSSIFRLCFLWLRKTKCLHIIK
uniref:Vomeronasal type-1 receptor n=1 Tax=Callithrix jacchus TaxID=9483 RepID=A0A5F4W7N9_CALJA|nr:vomeronasal type-1 receptor 4 [Callithrix jacchus]